MINIEYIKLSCSQLLFVHWLQGHLLPCPFKYITGIDCPGCGFQRSVIALIQGDLHQSWLLYPPAIPVLLFLAYGVAGRFFKLDNNKDTIKKTGYMIVGAIILVSYIVKMYGIVSHAHKVSI